MPFYSQEQGRAAFSVLTDEPGIHIFHRVKNINRHLSSLSILANHAWLYCIETRLSISGIIITEIFQLFIVLL